MAFLTGLVLIDAPAAALNNAGADDSARTQNAIATKFIRTRQGAIPYVSAQAFRFWLRTTLEADKASGWRAAPVFREPKVAYTDGNPLEWWDDDLFGYMRAPSKHSEAAARRRADTAYEKETPPTTGITRVSPFRVSTLLSLTPVSLVQDFGTMSRHDGDPVPHEHQFYHAVLKGLFSLDLHTAGTFSYRNRTGYRNLDEVRRRRAEELQLEHLQDEQSYRLPKSERIRRIATLVRGLSTIMGGAKQAIHYTDVTPAVVMAVVTRGGNNPLQYLIGASSQGLPQVHTEAVTEMVRAWGDQFLSALYVGWVQGFHDTERERLAGHLKELASTSAEPRLPHGFYLAHPREALARLADDIDPNAAVWLA